MPDHACFLDSNYFTSANGTKGQLYKKLNNWRGMCDLEQSRSICK